MSSPTPLPTRVRFLADIGSSYIDLNGTCDICHGAFDRGHHIAVRTKCQHIFGLSCLTRWTYTNGEQLNTCPNCRRALFIKPPDFPVFAAGYYSDSSYYYSLDMCTNPVSSRTIVIHIWHQMRQVNPQFIIYNGNIEAQIHRAGQYFADNFGLIFRIDPTHLVNLREVAKDMIREQAETQDVFEDASIGGMPCRWVRNLEGAWLPRVAEVFGWQLEEVRIHQQYTLRLSDSVWKFAM
jgi:hypothetical protein